MNDEKGASMDSPDGSCMSIFNSQDIVNEDAFSDNNPDDDEKVTYEEGGANVNENHVIQWAQKPFQCLGFLDWEGCSV